MVVSLRLPVLAAAAVLVAAAALLAPAAGSVGAVLAGNTWRVPVPDLDVLKGAEPLPVDPDGDQENLGPDPPPPPVVYHTTTEITHVPARISKGTPFVVEGLVKDDEGDPVAGAPVDVYLNESKAEPGFRVTKGTTDERGRFAIRGEVPPHLPAREYQVVAAMRDTLKGRELYLESWSDPPTSVYSDTRLKLYAPNQVAENEKVTLSGHVRDVTGGVVRDVVVTLHVDGTPVATTTTGGDGTYSFTYRFRGGGAHEVTVRYEGSANYGASMDTKTVRVAGSGLEVSTSRSIVRNSTLIVAGSLATDKGSLAGWGVDVVFVGLDLGENSTLHLKTDEAGEFRHTVHIPKSTPPGEYATIYSVSTLLLEENVTLAVFADTHLTLVGSSHLRPDDAFFANATLVDDNGVPLAARVVDLQVAGRGFRAFTDENGTASFTAADLPGGRHVASASYTGDGVHRGSDAKIPLSVDLTFLEAARPWWPWVVAAAIAAAVLAWALHPVGRRTLKRSVVVLDPRSPVALSLDLPGVEADLPDVWGVGETLTVVARAATREGAPLPSLALTLEAGAPQKLTTDATGRVRTDVSFAAEGTCTLVAAFAGDRRRRAAEVVREVRVVEYRRAIEEGFEDLRRLLASRGVPVHEATPPRELERRIHERIPALSQEDLDRLLTLFEISDYSERDIGREEWVVFQRAHAAVRSAVAPTVPPKRRMFLQKEVPLVE